LLDGEELVPQRVEPLQRLDDVPLLDLLVLEQGGAPSPHDHLGRAQQDPDLVGHRRFDLAGRHGADRTFAVSQLDAGCGPVEAVQAAAAARMAGRHDLAVWTNDQAF
jgi:hypothetical protein